MTIQDVFFHVSLPCGRPVRKTRVRQEFGLRAVPHLLAPLAAAQKSLHLGHAGDAGTSIHDLQTRGLRDTVPTLNFWGSETPKQNKQTIEHWKQFSWNDFLHLVISELRNIPYRPFNGDCFQDLICGQTINVLGRQIVLYDCHATEKWDSKMAEIIIFQLP